MYHGNIIDVRIQVICRWAKYWMDAVSKVQRTAMADTTAAKHSSTAFAHVRMRVLAFAARKVHTLSSVVLILAVRVPSMATNSSSAAIRTLY